MVGQVIASFLRPVGCPEAKASTFLMNAGLAVAGPCGSVASGMAQAAGKAPLTADATNGWALLNGAGGGAAAANCGNVLLVVVSAPAALVETLAGALIGSISLSGSIIAWASWMG